MTTTPANTGGSALPPEVELGVARENLSRAHALGTDDDITNARVAVESAKQRVGREVAARHADLIRSTLATLGERRPVSPVTLAAQGALSFPALVAAWRQDPGSLGLTRAEAAAADADQRNLRLVVLARKENRDFQDLQAEVSPDGHETYALAARADESVDEHALNDWLAGYLRSQGHDPGT